MARMRKNLAGKRFGALTAIEYIPGEQAPNGYSSWRCVCDCGKEKTVKTSDLTQERITSCGCGTYRRIASSATQRENHANVNDITGLQIGELTAIRFISKDRWLWRCSCGREKEIRASSVINGKTRSCGHILAETAAHKANDPELIGSFQGTHISTIRNIVSGKRASKSSTGVVGVREVHYSGGVVAYKARIVVQRKEIYLGQFGTLESAIDARKAAEVKYFGKLIAEYDRQQEEPKKE